MNSYTQFLSEVAADVSARYSSLDKVTIVFPNRRAILFFRKYLAAHISKPVFSPRMVTIEEFIQSFSTLRVLDKLQLIFELYKSYCKVMYRNGTPESFDRFYFWGDMLLRDFDEVDKYLVPATQLFKDLSHLKELDGGLDFLTEEQRAFLAEFWRHFDEKTSVSREKFLQVWRKLPEVYEQFREDLSSRGLAYEGMILKEVAATLANRTEPLPELADLIFVGFNALTTAEEKILSWFVTHHHADAFWDADTYYVNNEGQEAGDFFRMYQRHTILGKTFPENFPSNFDRKRNGSPVRVFATSQPVAQAKLLASILRDEFANGMQPDETLVVVPDEKLLIPLLHGIGDAVDKINVTMGFSLTQTPMYNLIELLTELHLHEKEGNYNHRQVTALLGHSYLLAEDPAVCAAKRKEILKTNWVSIPKGFLSADTDLQRLIFAGPEEHSEYLKAFVQYLREVTLRCGDLPRVEAMDKEFCFQFVTLLNRFELLLDEALQSGYRVTVEGAERRDQIKTFLKLFTQIVSGQKVPFSGEPLAGLQIMGVLETRNLDFKNVFVLSLNEGQLPSHQSRGSYIPLNVRKAYQLPTPEYQDSIYSYLFYRMLQRAENVSLFYNSETDVLGQGEMSRYLQQLVFESGWPIERKVLHHDLKPLARLPITVEKHADVLPQLYKINEGKGNYVGISPSALNTYLECRLRFYFQYVAGIRDPRQVEEELDARALGNLLHLVMEKFYQGIPLTRGKKEVRKEHFENVDSKMDALLDVVFIEQYRLDPAKKVRYKGQQLIVREVVRRFARRIFALDEAYAPFELVAIEQAGLSWDVKLKAEPFKGVLGGKVDRVDRKGDVLRIIDYKTGGDEIEFASVAGLFTREERKKKAVFQTFLYALLFYKQYATTETTRVLPGLMNKKNLFDADFKFGFSLNGEIVRDVVPLLEEFESHLQKLFEEIFDPAVPFDQAADEDICGYCSFSEICYRKSADK